MKKLLFLSIAAAISLTSVAQGNSGKSKNNGKGQAKEQKKDKRNDSRDDEWRNDNDRYDNVDSRRGRENQNTRGNNKNNGNAPRKVRDAFYADYPNADNVTWTKDRGTWTAYFRGGGLFGGNNQSVSYRANGQRLGSNNNVSTRRRTDQNSRTTDRNTTNNQSRPTIFEKARSRNN
jgi:hypothetical protein